MKEFRKNEQGLFICEECGKECKNLKGLGVHLFHSHKNISKQDYFDTWIKDENDGKCKICGNKTKFNGITYNNCCSIKCVNKYKHLRTEEENLKNFGVKNPYQRNDVKEKCEQIHLKNLGVKNPYQSDIIKEKCKQQHLKNYGVENVSQSKEIKKRKEESCFKHYGVTNILKLKIYNPMYIPGAFEKAQKTRFQLKNYKNTNINYRGSYELHFLEKYLNDFPDIQNSSKIKYKLYEKEHYYFPDFYIPSLNLIVEIKNSYLAKRYKEQIDAKEKATIASGFKYIMIVDKDYSEFSSYFKILPENVFNS